MRIEKLSSVIESILFVSSGLISVTNIARIINEDSESVTNKQIRNVLDLMEKRYKDESSGLGILRAGDSVQLISKIDNNEYVERILVRKKKKTLSQAALEVLSIIAYKQPITKVEIDEIRGVKSDSVMSTLLDMGMIEEKGRLDRIGKPILYGTTQKFLIEFGIKEIKDLPGKPKEISING